MKAVSGERFFEKGELLVSIAMKTYFVKGVLHPRPVFGLLLHFSQKLQHIGNK